MAKKYALIIAKYIGFIMLLGLLSALISIYNEHYMYNHIFNEKREPKEVYFLAAYGLLAIIRDLFSEFKG